VNKGNVTVALNKDVYNKKMEELLQDKNMKLSKRIP